MIIRFLVSGFLFFTLVLNAQKIVFKNSNFHKADSIANVYKGKSLKNLPILAYQLTKSLKTDIDKFRAIYTWVSTNIESDYYNVELNFRKRKKFKNDSLKLIIWKNQFSKKTFKKLLKSKKTVCTGYAYLIKELANLSSIDCEIVNGYGRLATTNINENSFANHSWNAVKLNDKWHLCDATWSSGYFIEEENKFIFDYNDGYFLAKPTIFIKDHFPLNPKWMLQENKPKFSDFFNAPLIYKYAYNYDLVPVVPKMMHFKTIKNKETIFLFKNSIKNNINDFNLVIGNNKSIEKPTITNLKNDLIQIKYIFAHTGRYDVHIRIKNDVVATYVVKVVKK